MNNAYGGAASRGDLDAQAVKATLDTGLSAVMQLTDAVAKRMSDGGAIVNIASMYGMVSPQPGNCSGAPSLPQPPA